MNLEKEVFELAIDDIMPNRFQPREKFDEHSLNELALSIKEHGVIQPIIVRKIGDKYEIVAGERRFRASKIVGKKTIPALIRNIEDKESAKIALLENLQRKNLTAIEEARTYQTILKLDNLTQEELANNLGKSQSAVANKLRLLNLDLEVQNALLEEKISERHARSLLNLEDRNKQKEYLQKVILNRMTVKQLDEEIAQITGKKIEETVEEPEGQNPPSGGIISNFVDSPEIVNAIVSDNVIPPTQNASSEVFPLPVEEQKNVLEQPAVESIPPISTESVLNNPTLEVPTSEPVVAENITEQPSQVPNFFNTRLSREKEEASILQPIEETREIVESTPIEESTPISSEMSAYDSIEKLLREGNEKQAEENKEIEEEKILDSLNNNIEEPKYSFEQPAVVETPIVTPAPVVEEPKYSFEQPTVEPVIQINETPVIESNNVVSDSMSEQVITPIIQTPVVEAKKDDIYDLRFAINNFRQAVQNTEKFGFNIETEEFDFNNIYQIVIKIDKNK